MSLKDSKIVNRMFIIRLVDMFEEDLDKLAASMQKNLNSSKPGWLKKASCTYQMCKVVSDVEECLVIPLWLKFDYEVTGSSRATATEPAFDGQIDAFEPDEDEFYDYIADCLKKSSTGFKTDDGYSNIREFIDDFGYFEKDAPFTEDGMWDVIAESASVSGAVDKILEGADVRKTIREII